jgi:hypothetical protein
MSNFLNDDDMDVLAAEYVLGTLDADERTRAGVLLDTDHGFRGMVRVWERRFGELHLMVEPVEPPPQLWERIKARVTGIPQSETVSVPAATPPLAPEAEPLDDLAELVAQLDRSREYPPLPRSEPKPEPKYEPIHATVRPEPGPVLTAAAAASEAAEAAETPPRQLRVWRLLALFLGVVAIGLVSLILAWRYAPDRLPPMLQPKAVLKLPEPKAAPTRPVAPPESQFDE